MHKALKDGLIIRGGSCTIRVMISSFISGIVLGVSAGFSPGPFMTLVVTHSLEFGVREGIKVALAPLITDAPIILLAAFVLSRLAASHILLGGISLAGSLFLAYLAYESFRTTGLDTEAMSVKPQSLRRGVMVNFLNPHPYLFWMTVGMPIIMKGWAESPINPVLFLGGFYLCLIGAKTVVAVSVGGSRNFFLGRPYLYIMRGLGMLMGLFALLLLWNALSLLVVMGPER